MKLITLWLISLCLFTACSKAPKQLVEAPPAYQPAPQATEVRMGITQAPKLVEVQDAVTRIFKDAAVVDTNYNPSFVFGDFNGDASQDIATIIKPVKLEEMNQDLPPWLLREPRSNKPPVVRLEIEKDEVLLAVIHGHGANDWRDPQATQTFLLKNVVGSDLRVENGKQFAEANSGKRLPRPQGDLIAEKLQGNEGYLYYATATYAWYDPKTFKGETQQPRMVHQPRKSRHHAHVQKVPEAVFITAEELKTKIEGNQSVEIIDVRSSEGFAASSTTIKGARHFKLRKLKTRLAFAPLKDLPRDRKIVTYCACSKDESSIKAAQILQSGGFTSVKVLRGGWHEWLRVSGPVQPK
jgi:rhodanese-related sulfurtransferase